VRCLAASVPHPRLPFMLGSPCFGASEDQTNPFHILLGVPTQHAWNLFLKTDGHGTQNTTRAPSASSSLFSSWVALTHLHIPRTATGP
jgi:hypothetical protein